MDKDTIPLLLVKHLSRDLVLNVEELLEAGAKRAFDKAKGMDDGHLPNVVGTLRHFDMNEGFAAALSAADASPTPLKGNKLVVGAAGIFRLARMNVRQGPWYNARRSTQRRELAELNAAMEQLVSPGLFESKRPITEASVFFVGIFSSSLKDGEKPLDIELAVPDRNMSGWLFRESVSLFVQRYNHVTKQPDIAVPQLKVQKQTGSTPQGT